MRDLERRGGQRHGHKEGAGRPTWPIKMPIKIMPHLAGGASNEPIFGEVGLNFWNKRRHEDNLKAPEGLSRASHKINIKGVESQTTFVTNNSGILRSTAPGER